MKEWKFNCAKAIGLSHIGDDIPCQDNVHTIYENGVNVISLSDGCGSGHFSQYGSDIVVKFITSYVSKNFDEIYDLDEFELKKRLTALIVKEVEIFASSNKPMLDEYISSAKGKMEYANVCGYEISSSLKKEEVYRLFIRQMFDATVLFVAVKDDKYITGHCGDGFILALKNSKMCVMSEEPKTGASNETNYPSTILALVSAEHKDEYYNLFRIQKGKVDEYDGFLLMSDGAEKTLVKKVNKVSVPAINNDSILFEIVSNETEKDATNYLVDLLENGYRSRTNPEGEVVEITDDDVSVAILVANGYKIEGVEEVPEKKEEPVPTEVKETNDVKPDVYSMPSELSKIQEEYLGKLLRKDTDAFDKEKYEWLTTALSLLKKTLKEKNATFKEAKVVLQEKIYADKDDLKEILRYASRCKVIDQNRNLISDGGESNAN